MNNLNHTAISQAHSLARVIELINRSGDEANEMAAQYALDAAIDSGYGASESNIEAHLEILQNGTIIDTGDDIIPVKPNFNFGAALKIAVENMGKPQ